MRYLRTVAFLILLASSTQAASTDIRPGRYVRDGDSGTLTVRRGAQNQLVFEIDATGANCHSCGVSGVIRAGIGHADGGDAKCTIAFSATQSGLLVKPTAFEECRYYCGARAGFDGTYRSPPSACTDAGRQKSRDRSLASYRARRYQEAATTLQALVAKCEVFMGWIELDQVRNDLALSHYHRGEFAQCLGALNATLAADFENEERLRSGGPRIYLPPCDFDNYLDVAKATWFNKALCTKGQSRR